MSWDQVVCLVVVLCAAGSTVLLLMGAAGAYNAQRRDRGGRR